MKNIRPFSGYLLLIILPVLLHASNGGGLNPTIINGNVILCPGEQVTLETQEYDTYQWYKNGNIIPGAVFQTLVVGYNDAGYNFTVFVTQGAQSAMSPSILVDGWLFNPLVVSNYGQGFWFTPGVGWELCEYHELFFEVMLPYHNNVQWYRNGVPIFGANSPVYGVQETGVYAVSGSPELCPNYVQYSIDLPVIVHVAPLPVITQIADTLYTSVFPGQWYAGDDIIPGATGQYLIPDTTAWYSFEFTDSHGCKKMSEAYYYVWDPLGLPTENALKKPQISLKDDLLTIRFAPEMEYRIFSISGAVLLEGETISSPVNVSSLGKGLFIIQLFGNEAIYFMKFMR
ncbi:MAG: hypothetical protein IH597_12340 [Bacteroidales bacterium]|nr:hypothetical protein [Bacteroidales bacterium]